MELLNIKSARHFHNYFISTTKQKEAQIHHVWLESMPTNLILWLGGSTTPNFEELWK